MIQFARHNRSLAKLEHDRVSGEEAHAALLKSGADFNGDIFRHPVDEGGHAEWLGRDPGGSGTESVPNIRPGIQDRSTDTIFPCGTFGAA